LRRLVLSAGLSVGLILSACPSLAQPKPAAPAVAEAPVSAKKRELARRMFDAMHFAEMVDKMMESMDPFMAMGESQALSANDNRLLRESVREAMSEAMPDYIEALTDIYAEAFTEEELEAMVTFYESPIGQSVLKKSNELGPQVTEAIMELMPDILLGTMERFCGKTNCSDSMKDKLRKQAS